MKKYFTIEDQFGELLVSGTTVGDIFNDEYFQDYAKKLNGVLRYHDTPPVYYA